MSTPLRVALLGSLSLVTLAFLAVIFVGRERLLTLILGPIETFNIDFHTLQRHERPNQYLVCPPATCTATPDAVSPVYDVPVTVLRTTWLGMILQQPRVERLAVSADELQYDFVQRTRLLHFPDTITVRFIPLSSTRSTLAIYSRSHYGYSDFGVNRHRITSWLASVQAKLPTAPH
jgi:uncharacterized protein (DUF1499 family)